MNLDKGILYFTTYDNNRINAVDMHKADLDSKDLICYDLFKKQDIEYMNQIEKREFENEFSFFILLLFDI